MLWDSLAILELIGRVTSVRIIRLKLYRMVYVLDALLCQVLIAVVFSDSSLNANKDRRFGVMLVRIMRPTWTYVIV